MNGTENRAACGHGVRDALRHRLNPLHLFCRLRQAGMGPGAARRMCAWYERLYRRML